MGVKKRNVCQNKYLIFQKRMKRKLNAMQNGKYWKRKVSDRLVLKIFIQCLMNRALFFFIFIISEHGVILIQSIILFHGTLNGWKTVTVCWMFPLFCTFLV